MTLNLGNFPPHSTLILTANCSQKLEVVDLSYCLTIPMAYIPRYMGNLDTVVLNGTTLYEESLDQSEFNKQSELKAALDAVKELNDMPIATKSGAIWDLNVKIRSNSPISRLVSLNHPIGVQFGLSNT